MSYDITLSCGCTVYVSCDPRTNVPHTRVLDRRDPACRDRRHEVGTRLWLWQLLPEPPRPAPVRAALAPLPERPTGTGR